MLRTQMLFVISLNQLNVLFRKTSECPIQPIVLMWIKLSYISLCMSSVSVTERHIICIYNSIYTVEFVSRPRIVRPLFLVFFCPLVMYMPAYSYRLEKRVKLIAIENGRGSICHLPLYIFSTCVSVHRARERKWERRVCTNRKNNRKNRFSFHRPAMKYACH